MPTRLLFGLRILFNSKLHSEDKLTIIVFPVFLGDKHGVLGEITVLKNKT